MKEIWKPVPNYLGLYEVSNKGNVRSLTALIQRRNGTVYKRPGRLLTCGRSSKDYVQVILSKSGKTRCFGVHCLVAQAFIPNPNNLPCVNHKDENRSNNCVDNLEWCTYAYNNSYNNRIERCKSKISATLKGRKRVKPLTVEQHEHIREGARKGWETRRRHLKEQEEI